LEYLEKSFFSDVYQFLPIFTHLEKSIILISPQELKFWLV
jgi:hypothetical protein